MATIFEFDLRLQHPFTCMVCGPTQCGKTQFVFKLLRYANSMIFPPPERIIWFFGYYQESFRDLFETVEFVKGLPPSSDYLDGRRTLVIIDDLMSETDDRVTKLFTKGSHHKNASVIYLSQNLYHRGKENRNISLNTHYLILFKNPRDSGQILYLGRQLYPGKAKFFSEVFADATSKPYGYLLIDLKTITPDELRLRMEIFPREKRFVYIYK